MKRPPGHGAGGARNHAASAGRAQVSIMPPPPLPQDKGEAALPSCWLPTVAGSAPAPRSGLLSHTQLTGKLRLGEVQRPSQTQDGNWAPPAASCPPRGPQHSVL